MIGLALPWAIASVTLTIMLRNAPPVLAQNPRPATSDKDLLQGIWRAVYFEMEGQRFQWPSGASEEHTISGDLYSMKVCIIGEERGIDVHRFHIDPAANPK